MTGGLLTLSAATAGSPGEDVGSSGYGGVAVRWGSASGITGKGVTVADPAPSCHDTCGRLLAAGSNHATH